MEIKDKRAAGNTEFFTVVLDCGTEIKDCKVVKGGKGEFIGGPSRKGKDKDGNEKWFSQVYFPNNVQEAIIALYHGEESQPF